MRATNPPGGAQRVTIFSLNYAPEVTGIAPYTASLATNLAARDSQVRVIATHPHYPQWRIHEGFGQWTQHVVESGVKLSRLRHYVPKPPSTNATRLLSEVTFGLRTLTVSWNDPDAMLLVSPALISSAMTLAAVRLRSLRPGSRRPRTVVWVHDIYSAAMNETSSGRGRIAGALRRFEMHTYRQADHLVAVHERFKTTLVEDLGQDPDKITVIRNWTHLAPVTAARCADVRAEHGWRDDEIVVLHAGNQGAKQHLDQVVEAGRLAHERRQPIRFVLLGGGNQHQRLRELAQGLPTVQFIETLPDAAYQHAMQAADVLLVSEGPHVREMSVPSKLTSYFSAGRPVLAITDPASITASEVRLSGAGECVNPGDPDAVLAAVMWLGMPAESNSTYAVNGPRFVAEHLLQDRCVERFAEVLHLAETQVPAITPDRATAHDDDFAAISADATSDIVALTA